jgi:purine-binding chemotaxis protein CheW
MCRSGVCFLLRDVSTITMSESRVLLAFGTCEKECALPLEDIQEIVLMAWLSRPPSMASILEGFLNLRGVAIPVVSVRRMFQWRDRAPDLYSPLIILRGAGHPLALLVDYVAQVITTSGDASLRIQTEHSFNQCAVAEVAVGDRVIHLLSCDRLLTEKERQCVREFQAVEQQRLQDLEARPA